MNKAAEVACICLISTLRRTRTLPQMVLVSHLQGHHYELSLDTSVPLPFRVPFSACVTFASRPKPKYLSCCTCCSILPFKCSPCCAPFFHFTLSPHAFTVKQAPSNPHHRCLPFLLISQVKQDPSQKMRASLATATTAAAVVLLLALLPSTSNALASSARPGAMTTGYLHQPMASVGGSRRLNALAMARRTAHLYQRSVVAMSAAAPTKKEETGIGWNSHKPVTEVPESLVRGVEGNESMRRRFEKACREAQVGREGGGGGEYHMLQQRGGIWMVGCKPISGTITHER